MQKKRGAMTRGEVEKGRAGRKPLQHQLAVTSS